jgi:hypothetical protein
MQFQIVDQAIKTIAVVPISVKPQYLLIVLQEVAERVYRMAGLLWVLYLRKNSMLIVNAN